LIVVDIEVQRAAVDAAGLVDAVLVQPQHLLLRLAGKSGRSGQWQHDVDRIGIGREAPHRKQHGQDERGDDGAHVSVSTARNRARPRGYRSESVGLATRRARSHT